MNTHALLGTTVTGADVWVEHGRGRDVYRDDFGPQVGKSHDTRAGVSVHIEFRPREEP